MDTTTFSMSRLLFSTAATKYATVASTTVLIWDMILTFDLELNAVWRAKKTFGTVLFLLNRYIPPAVFAYDLYSQFVYQPSPRSCERYEVASTILDLISIAVIECVLVMRTHALYQHRLVLTGLSLLYITSMAIMLACFLLVFKYETFMSASVIGFRGCLSACTGPHCQPLAIAFWIPFFVFETLVFTLTLWKSYQSYKMEQLLESTTITKILVRDGLMYYLIIMAASLCNFLIWILDPFASYLAVGLLKSLQVTICSRILLNLRGMVSTGQFTASQVEFTASHLEFAASQIEPSFLNDPEVTKPSVNPNDITSHHRK